MNTTTTNAILTGSEKQIKWAGDIRTRFERQLTPDTFRTGYLDCYTYALENITEAKWWIETRNVPSLHLLGLVCAHQQGESLWSAARACGIRLN